MRIGVATQSPEKIKGVTSAFSRFFNVKESEIEVQSFLSSSGVPQQPFGDEIYQGALNRTKGIYDDHFDFCIGCEAGIERAFDRYFNVQVVCIIDRNGNELWGKSAGWQIPFKDIEKIRNQGLDSYLRGKGLTCIQELLGDSNSRSNAVAQATELALAAGRL